MVNFESVILADIWEKVLESFHSASKKHKTSGFDLFEDFLPVSSFLSLRTFEEIQQTGWKAMNRKEKVYVKISPQVVLILPNAFIEGNFQFLYVVVLLLKEPGNRGIEIQN